MVKNLGLLRKKPVFVLVKIGEENVGFKLLVDMCYVRLFAVREKLKIHSAAAADENIFVLISTRGRPYGRFQLGIKRISYLTDGLKRRRTLKLHKKFLIMCLSK